MTRRVYVWQRSDALDEATAARRSQPRAQCLGRFASIRRDADAMPDRRVAHGRAHDERLTAAEARWDAQMKPYQGRKVITYHQSWPNFLKRFGLQVADFVEPRPGIPPSPSHVVELIALMKRQGVKLIMVEPYFDLRTPESIARATGGTVAVLMPSVGGVKEITDYFKLFDYDINLLVKSFTKVN